ncbi:MAG: methylmalonyl-CoA mutase family protein, partial [Bacteroidota bacterium]
MKTNGLDEFRSAKNAWAEKAVKVSRQLQAKFTTVSGEPIELLYTPDDVAHINVLHDIGFPGEYPYTRGIH